MTQSPLFYQIDRVKTYINPAYIGMAKSFVYENTYQNHIDGDFQTIFNSFQQYLGKGHAIALNFIHDNQFSLIKSNEYNIGYRKGFTIKDKGELNFGVQGAYWTNKLDIDNLTFGDMIDPRQGFIYTSADTFTPKTSGFDAHAGFNFVHKYFYIGSSVKHLLEPNQSFTKGGNVPLAMLFTGQAGFKLNIKKFEFIGHVEFYQQGNAQNLVNSLKVRYKKLQLDAGFAPESAWFLGLASNFKLFKFAYNFTRMTAVDALAHEVRSALNLNLFKKENKLPFEF